MMDEQRLAYDPSIAPCPKCGAWMWMRQVERTWMVAFVGSILRCGECAHEAHRYDLLAPVMVGMD